MPLFWELAPEIFFLIIFVVGIICNRNSGIIVVVDVYNYGLCLGLLQLGQRLRAACRRLLRLRRKALMILSLDKCHRGLPDLT